MLFILPLAGARFINEANNPLLASRNQHRFDMRDRSPSQDRCSRGATTSGATTSGITTSKGYIFSAIFLASLFSLERAIALVSQHKLLMSCLFHYNVFS